MLADLEGDLIKRMRLREVLADPDLARRLTPSMSLVERLLRDKATLSGAPPCRERRHERHERRPR